MTLLIQILHREMIQEILVMLLMMVRIPVTILIRNWMTVVSGDTGDDTVEVY